jgi:hypothetical protein
MHEAVLDVEVLQDRLVIFVLLLRLVCLRCRDSPSQHLGPPRRFATSPGGPCHDHWLLRRVAVQAPWLHCAGEGLCGRCARSRGCSGGMRELPLRIIGTAVEEVATSLRAWPRRRERALRACACSERRLRMCSASLSAGTAWVAPGSACCRPFFV